MRTRNKTLHWTAIPLRSIAASELGRSRGASRHGNRALVPGRSLVSFWCEAPENKTFDRTVTNIK